jgi:hypothetical protein
MYSVLRSIDSLTPDWLTQILRAHSTLPHGHVTRVMETRNRHMASLNYFLSVEYSHDAPTNAPKTLFFKLSRAERLPLTDSEVAYYTQMVAAMTNPPTPICYDARFDPDSGAYHILLEDVSATHGVVELSLPPRIRHAEMMVDVMADFHTFWWMHPRLNEVSTLPTPEVFERYVRFCEGGLQNMSDYMGDRLLPSQRALIEKVFAKHSSLMARRAAQNKHLTLIHGDTHLGNFLLPFDMNGRAYLIDRQPFDWSLTCWLGASDLAYMMVHWWFPEWRRAQEKPMLQRYLNRLHANGIDYTWEQLWEDYRLCAMQNFYVAVEWSRDALPQDKAWLWYPQLQKTLIAFDDLHCAELLD